MGRHGTDAHLVPGAWDILGPIWCYGGVAADPLESHTVLCRYSCRYHNLGERVEGDPVEERVSSDLDVTVEVHEACGEGKQSTGSRE